MDESNKRQRITSYNDNNELHITDLPDGLLVGIASYLAKPSAVLFAISMATNSQEQTQTSKAILTSNNWSVLDFGDVEKDLAAKLSDDHIDKILKCFEVYSKLTVLKLAGCVNIAGQGLVILGFSTLIQQIDMSLVGKHESPLLEPEPLLSQDVVLPILDSCISLGRGSSLKQLEFPKKWRKVRSTQFGQFLERYNQYLTSQRYCCTAKCENVIDSDDWVYRERDEWYGTQNYTCSACVKHCCYDCGGCTGWCEKCEKEYCGSCIAMIECDNCCKKFCDECQGGMNECEREGCERTLCEYCFEKRKCHHCNSIKCDACINSYQCDLDGCDKAICADCVESKGEGGACDDCDGEFCSTECRYLACDVEVEDGTETCVTCLKAAASGFRRKLQESKKENEELCQGMDDLYKKYMNVDGDGDN